MLGERGLAGAGRAMKAQAAVAPGLERGDDAGHLIPALQVEHVQAVLRDAGALRHVGPTAQREIGVFQLALNQIVEQRRSGLATAFHSGLGHWHQRLAHQLLARARRWAFEFEVVGEAAPKRRVNLFDAVGHPQRGHRVGFQNLVDPGLAADAAGVRRGHVFGARHELRGLAGNRREHVFHLVEQQRRVRRAFEEHLRDLQRAVAVAPAQRIAIAVGVFHLKQCQPGGLCHHPSQLGFAGAGRTINQHVHTRLLARHRLAQQGRQQAHVVTHKSEIVGAQTGARSRAGEHRHQLVLRLVLAHQHRRQLLAHLHQIGQIGDVVLGDQVFHHADALQPRTRTQRLAHFAGLHAGHIGERGVGLGCVVHLELDQDGAQIALVARQRAVEQQRALGAVELQQTGQRVDVFLYQRGVFLERLAQPVAGHSQHRQQVFRRLFGVLVEVEKQRALFVGAAPDTVALHEGRRAQPVVASPEFVVFATPAQKLAHPGKNRLRPDQMPPRQREQGVEIAAHIEARALARGQSEHEMRTHEIEHRRLAQAGRHKHAALARFTTRARGR